MQNRKQSLAHLAPEAVAVTTEARRIRRPQVAKQPFSRRPAQAAAQDGVDTSVRVSFIR